jgi:AcrR family transcriptional regulator
VAFLGTRKRSLHARGIERRRLLLASARALLAERGLDQISLSDVAARANVPKGSAYHFYEDIQDLYSSLLVELQRELIAVLERPLNGRMRRWQDVVWILIRRGAEFYTQNAAARQLQIGPRTPPQLKLSDRRSDIAIASLFEKHIDTCFELPSIADRSQIFFRAVEIADLMFCLSVLEAGTVTRAMCEEAHRAATAYLASYLPAELTRREPAPPRRSNRTRGAGRPRPRPASVP